MNKTWTPADEQFYEDLGLQTSVGIADVVNQLKGLAAEDVRTKMDRKHLIAMNLEKLTSFDIREDQVQGKTKIIFKQYLTVFFIRFV